jgi:RNA polymerase-binding transcription factor DksA
MGNKIMNKTLDLEAIRKELEERSAILSIRLRVKPNQPGTADFANADRHTQAQAHAAKERQSTLAARLEATLEQVESALERLDDGTYGQCVRCEREISPDRLMALPYASLCIDCQEQLQNDK